jgi:CBS domain-containing protein
MKVADLMTKDVTTLLRNDVLSMADDLMQLARIRHLPVLDEETGELAGIVSQRDLFAGALARAFGYGSVAQRRVQKTIALKEVMTTELFTTTAETPLRDAARTMVKHKIGCLPVLDDGKLVGILTEGDFVGLVAREKLMA